MPLCKLRHYVSVNVLLFLNGVIKSRPTPMITDITSTNCFLEITRCKENCEALKSNKRIKMYLYSIIMARTIRDNLIDPL